MKKVLFDKIELKLPEKKSFLIIGSGDPVKTFIKKLDYYFPGSPVFIVSEKRCDYAWSMHETEFIESIAKSKGFSIEFPEEINTKEMIDKIKTRGCNICFVLGSRWILKKDIIKNFNGNIFNYHPANLPHYRGGGGNRWQIMNQEKSIYIAFHQVALEIDQGPILAVSGKKIKEIKYPKNIFDELYKFSLEYFDIFLKKFSQVKQIELTKQDMSQASYFPLLDNNVNGAIDLSWNKKDIKLFVEAFSYPYKGAFLFYKDKKIFIKEVEISKRQKLFHPYAIGIIVNKTKKFLEIVVKDGSVLFKEMRNENNEKLLKSNFFRPVNKKFILQINENNKNFKTKI